MKVTVILCTFNRCESLAKALQSLAASVLPESVKWEVLVVDNHSSDSTRQVVEGFCERWPGRFRYAFEATPGKSNALNRGIQEAQSDVLAFTDDDVAVDPAWLQNLTAHLDNGNWAGAGGRILPNRPFSPPGWMPSRQRYALAPLTIFDPKINDECLKDAPFGANMAFQRRVFEQYGNFRVDLGPGIGGDTPEKSEDTEFGHRLLNAGERIRYEPSAIVYHVLPAERVRQSYFLHWWFDKARADVRAFGVSPDIKRFVAGIPLHLFRRLFMGFLRWMFTVEPSLRFERKLKLWAISGEMAECYRQSQARKGRKLKAAR